MFTVKVGDQEEVCYQFADLLVGDFFQKDGRVFVRSWNNPGVHRSDVDGDDNAIDLQYNCGEHFDPEDIVEPITMEWEDAEDV